jgi:hypothetical protein
MRPYILPQRLEEAIVAKPGTGHNQARRLVNFHGNSAEHRNSLDMLTLKVRKQ